MPVPSRSREIWCRATASELRLRPKAAVLAERFDAACVRPVTADERQAVAPVRTAAERLPLRGIILPLPDHAHCEARARALPASEAAFRLARCQRIEGWEDPARLQIQFMQVMAIVQKMPVFEVKAPWGRPFPDDLADQVVRACHTVTTPPGKIR